MTSSVLVLIEASLSASGPLDTALAYVRAAADAGVDLLRFAPPVPEPLPPGEPVSGGTGLMAPPPPWEEEAWIDVRKETLRAGLDFMAGAETLADVRLLSGVGIMGWSLSACVDPEVVEAAAQTHLPIWLRGDWSAGDVCPQSAALVRRYDLELTVLHEPAQRPTPPEGLGLDLVPELRERGFPRVGFCDRSGTGWPALAAVALGADVVELSLALSPYLPGAKSAGALAPEALKTTVEGARYLAWARAHPGNI